MDRILNKDISNHQGSYSSSKEVKIEMSTRVKGEPNHSKIKFAELEASNTNSQIFQKTTNASLKNLETQIGQLALNLQNQMKDAFPSDTKKNPKDCMAVQLKSGKDLEEKT